MAASSRHPETRRTRRPAPPRPPARTAATRNDPSNRPPAPERPRRATLPVRDPSRASAFSASQRTSHARIPSRRRPGPPKRTSIESPCRQTCDDRGRRHGPRRTRWRGTGTDMVTGSTPLGAAHRHTWPQAVLFATKISLPHTSPRVTVAPTRHRGHTGAVPPTIDDVAFGRVRRTAPATRPADQGGDRRDRTDRIGLAHDDHRVLLLGDQRHDRGTAAGVAPRHPPGCRRASRVARSANRTGDDVDHRSSRPHEDALTPRPGGAMAYHGPVRTPVPSRCSGGSGGVLAAPGPIRYRQFSLPDGVSGWWCEMRFRSGQTFAVGGDELRCLRSRSCGRAGKSPGASLR